LLRYRKGSRSGTADDGRICQTCLLPFLSERMLELVMQDQIGRIVRELNDRQ